MPPLTTSKLLEREQSNRRRIYVTLAVVLVALTAILLDGLCDALGVRGKPDAALPELTNNEQPLQNDDPTPLHIAR